MRQKVSPGNPLLRRYMRVPQTLQKEDVMVFPVGMVSFFYNPPFLPLLLEQEKKNQQTHIRSKHGSRNLTAIGAMADVGVDETIAFDGLLFLGRKNCQLICSYSVWILKE